MCSLTCLNEKHIHGSLQRGQGGIKWFYGLTVWELDSDFISFSLKSTIKCFNQPEGHPSHYLSERFPQKDLIVQVHRAIASSLPW